VNESETVKACQPKFQPLRGRNVEQHNISVVGLAASEQLLAASSGFYGSEEVSAFSEGMRVCSFSKWQHSRLILHLKGTQNYRNKQTVKLV